MQEYLCMLAILCEPCQWSYLHPQQQGRRRYPSAWDQATAASLYFKMYVSLTSIKLSHE